MFLRIQLAYSVVLGGVSDRRPAIRDCVPSLLSWNRCQLGPLLLRHLHLLLSSACSHFCGFDSLDTRMRCLLITHQLEVLECGPCINDELQVVDRSFGFGASAAELAATGVHPCRSIVGCG
ncbi:hypothetical protein Mp_8g07750 [Marchantia polymorpha subsp. ruderalis]|uniref:Uncharacterized protein n=1 Tax=Marchantia polymorpha TaxID=3197 RepID=A0A2R6XI39_MARPO|nr:hypothetical protein MARPO_0013s0020 [Marchantia polymorpha]PTQ45762.1 hypothetical protein MARPO_0013s0020 [Marchantia polymorpha]BBN19084.1 hypothetical protein Mp_8g07750 [Marchantia polymorpha subsp. ruderalis]BBN19085.1 hypothetical protein Mp_8g07750 [Marchantia polymorpha subsp. ruderalis]|eukprot:PTQ45761.1 hypothetical protein MARPO_0013s0020 [Marchantia polymorpha]